MYRPGACFKRTAEERRDPLLSWQREDVAFFAAGACHILAYAFLATYPAAGFHAVGLWSRAAGDPGHVYVTDGAWAFDHGGWTPESELLSAFDPWERALRYLTRFPAPGAWPGPGERPSPP